LIDSIQTIYSDELEAIPGSISQVKYCASKLIELGKSLNIPIIIIGHVTKEGTVAGPKTLEHLVDTVLYLEGEHYQNLRILRGVKNRFGATNEIGVFEMKKEGLMEVINPSEIFLKERLSNTPGSVVTSTLEGMRTFMLEVQGLTTKTVFGYPKRTSSGFDVNRMQLLLAVLSKRTNVKLGDRDVYLNIVGGFKISEPAADLAICLAVASSYLNKPIGSKIAVWGEVGLSGEIRSISQIDKRISEAKKLGFRKIIIPEKSEIKQHPEINIIKVKSLNEAISKSIE
jgi:DNA repair protein RadA/Sms